MLAKRFDVSGAGSRHNGVTAAGWNERREELRRYLPNRTGDLRADLTADNILAESFLTALVAARYSPTFQQVDVRGLDEAFVMHPAGDVASDDRVTAIRICDDLGLDFDKLSVTPR